MEIDGIINNILSNKKSREKYCAALLKIHWPQIIGEKVAERSCPTKIDNGVLFLQVVGSAWAQNLFIMKKELLGKINVFPAIISLKSKISDLRITSVPKIERDLLPVEEETEIVLPELTQEELSQAYEAVAVMRDEALASNVARVLIKDKRHKKYHWQKTGSRCEKCGAVLAYKRARCVVCDKDLAQKKKEQLLWLLADTPWLEYADAQKETECSRLEFFSAKEECRQKFLLRALAKNASNSDISRYVMIKTGCPIFLLTQDLVDKTMEEARRSNHVPALGFRRYDTRK